MPLQLSCLDHCDCGSRPGDAEQGVVGVEAGDVVVVGSDGLWDNLWEHQLLAALREEQQQVRGSWAGLLVVCGLHCWAVPLDWALGCTAGKRASQLLTSCPAPSCLAPLLGAGRCGRARRPGHG